MLAPHGSLCFELGDTFSGSGGAGGDNGEGLDAKNEGCGSSFDRQWQADRDFECMHALGTVLGLRRQRYGTRRARGVALSISPFASSPSPSAGHSPTAATPSTGARTEPWRVRNVVRWCRPNPPVGALGDKFRPATSDIVVACKSRTRWFDLDAVREPESNTHARPTSRSQQRERSGKSADRRRQLGEPDQSRTRPGGRPTPRPLVVRRRVRPGRVEHQHAALQGRPLRHLA